MCVCVFYPLQCGADITCKNNQNLTPLEIVQMYTDPRSQGPMKQLLQGELVLKGCNRKKKKKIFFKKIELSTKLHVSSGCNYCVDRMSLCRQLELEIILQLNNH